MKDPYDEGLATHIGLESCVYIRKGIDEALTRGVRAGLLSRERCCKFMVPTLSPRWKETPTASIPRNAVGPCVVRDPEHLHKLFTPGPRGTTFGLITVSVL